MATNTMQSMCLFFSILSIIIPVTWTYSKSCNDGNCWQYEEVYCPSGESCTLNCNDGECDRRRRSLLQGRSLLQQICNGGCNNMRLYCAADQLCTVNANGGNSDGLIIYAEDASELQINKCGSDCDSMKIYCPQNGRGGTDNTCRMEITSDVDNVEIYTQESIHDFELDQDQSGDLLYSATLYCGATQQYSCTMENDGSNCLSSQSSECKDGYRLPTEAPTNDPTQSPSADPTKGPSNSPTVDPTNKPTYDPTISPTFTANPTSDPTTSPTREPSTDPTAGPTKTPTDGPSNSPTSIPSKAPTSPTSIPTPAPVSSPANILNANPPTSPPTPHPTNTEDEEIRDGEILDDGSGAGGLNAESEPGLFDDLPFWVYIIAGCAGVCCCLTLIMVICKCKERKKNKGKVEFGGMNYNSTNPPKESMDVWTNPVHHQVGSQSPVPMIAEGGGGNDTTTGIHRVVSASDDVFDDDLSSQHENYGQMYTKSNRANIGFGENLSNNVAADDAVMDDIIGHMATPMGASIDDYDEDDDTPTVEMAEIDTRGGGRGENHIIIPDSLMNADNDDIDNINNNLINNNHGNGNDEDVLDDIDMMGATAGNDDDDDIIDDIDYDEDVVNDINEDMGGDIITPNNPNDQQHEEGGTYEEEHVVETIGGDLIDDDEFVIEDDDHGTPQDDGVLDDDELDYIGNGANDDDDNIVGDIDMMGVTAGGHDDDDEVDDIDDIDDIDYDEDVVNNIDDFVHTIQ